MLEFVDSDLYFVQDRNNFINPLLQVGSGSGGPINTGSDRIRILIPGYKYTCYSALADCHSHSPHTIRVNMIVDFKKISSGHFTERKQLLFGHLH